jgi:hypothetical protein
MTSYNLQQRKEKNTQYFKHKHSLGAFRNYGISATLSPGHKLNNESSTSHWRTQAMATTHNPTLASSVNGLAHHFTCV